MAMKMVPSSLAIGCRPPSVSTIDSRRKTRFTVSPSSSCSSSGPRRLNCRPMARNTSTRSRSGCSEGGGEAKPAKPHMFLRDSRMEARRARLALQLHPLELRPTPVELCARKLLKPCGFSIAIPRHSCCFLAQQRGGDTPQQTRRDDDGRIADDDTGTAARPPGAVCRGESEVPRGADQHA